MYFAYTRERDFDSCTDFFYCVVLQVFIFVRCNVYIFRFIAFPSL